MKPISILHLSDIHYGSKSAFQDDDKTQLNAALRTSAFRNLNHLLKHSFLEQKLDSVIISGDTTTQGRREGFRSFVEHTASFLAGIVDEPRSVCVVAGNHDVKWDLDPQLPDYFDQKFKDYFDFVREIGATSCLVPTGTLPESPYEELSFSPELPGPLYVKDEDQLIILCLNSSIRCGEVNMALRNSLSTPILSTSSTLESLLTQHPNDSQLSVAVGTAQVHLKTLLRDVHRSSLFDIPHVTHTQLDKIRSLLVNKRNEIGAEWPSYAKIAVFHHHVVPFNYQQPEHKPFELMADSAAVLDTLGSFGFQLILTGHKHQPYVQPVNFRGTDLLVAGGMTIGGYPVHRFGQGVRHLQIQRTDDHTSIKIADLPCDWQGDLYTRVRELVSNAPQYILQHARPTRRVSFPSQIESAVDAQIYDRSFYKSNVVFDVDITEAGGGQLEFMTTLSYAVVNRSSEPQVWRTEYNYVIETGKVLEAKVNGNNYDPDNLEFRAGRGLSIPVQINGNDKGRAYLKVNEFFPSQGAIRYTSFHPATDLKVILRTNAPNFEFDYQVLYFWDIYPVEKKDYVEAHFEQGVLPFQGLQLNWRLKEVVR